MNNNDMNNKIKDAFEKATPDILDRILSDIEAEREIIVVSEPPKKKRPIMWRAIGLAAALAVTVGAVFGMYSFRSTNSVCATVSLDVNPSVTIEVNSKETVISVTAGNIDGEQIIGGMDFSGSSLDVTISALIGSMLKHGYISDISNSILVSVNGDDQAKNTELKDRLTRDIGQLLQTENFSGAVIGQTVEDSDLEALAEEYGITEGKAQLIRRIINGSDAYTFEELAALSINELNLIADSANTQVDNVDQIGSPSDKAYIGINGALDAALDHAGLTMNDINTFKTDMNLKDGAMVYEIDLNYFGNDYGFMVNATDGTVIMFNNTDNSSTPAVSDSGTVSSETAAPEPEPEPETAVQPEPESEPEPKTQISSTTKKPTPATTTTTPKAEPEPEPEPELPIKVSVEDAKLIAARHATASNVIDFTCELKVDNGTPKYKIRFWSTNFYKSNGYRWDYEISAYSGTIISSKMTEDASHYPESREVFEFMDPHTKTGTLTYREYSGYSLNFINNAVFPEYSEFNTNTLSGTDCPAVLSFDTSEKFDSFIGQIESANLNYGGNEAREAKAFMSDAEMYDSEFFKENNLYIISFTEKHSSVYYDFGCDYLEGTDVLQFHFYRRDHGASDNLAKYTYFVIAIPKADVNGSTVTECFSTWLDASSMKDPVTKLYYMKKNVTA